MELAFISIITWTWCHFILRLIQLLPDTELDLSLGLLRAVETWTWGSLHLELLFVELVDVGLLAQGVLRS